MSVPGSSSCGGWHLDRGIRVLPSFWEGAGFIQALFAGEHCVEFGI
jgi:hypothetical protein